MKKAYLRCVATIINMIAKESNQDVRNTTLIVGSARSGTTYLMESLNSNNDYRLIFEPFTNSYTSEWRDYPARHYINPKNPHEKDINSLSKILSGQVHNKWVDQYNRKIHSHKRLIKAVRANLLIEYIRTQYPDLPIIYLIRNPYDVVASRINMKFNSKDFNEILNYKVFMDIHYPDIKRKEILQKTTTPEGKHAALWCLENRFLIRNTKELNLILLHYNDTIGMSIKYKKGEIVLNKKQSSLSASSTDKRKYELSKIERDNIHQVLQLFDMH